MSTSRHLIKEARSALLEDMIQTLFVAEVMDPSECVWLVCPWMRDVPVINNLADGFTWLEESWGGRSVSLLDWVRVLCEKKNTQVILRTSQQEQDQAFLRQVSALKAGLPTPALLDLDVSNSLSKPGGLHAKGILTSHFYLMGSMNFSSPGLTMHQEALELKVADDPGFSAAAAAYRMRWGTNGL